MTIKEDNWDAIRQLLEDAQDAGNEELRRIFKYGTPAEKRAELDRRGLAKADLEDIHEKLENVFHNSPLKFWWW